MIQNRGSSKSTNHISGVYKGAKFSPCGSVIVKSYSFPISAMEYARGSQDSADSRIEMQDTYGEDLFWQADSKDILIGHLLSTNAPLFVISEIYYKTEGKPCGGSVEINSSFPGDNCSLSYSRKEKSLSELTKKFIYKFEGSRECTLALDLVTKQMNVERRRIYDVINIMESLGVVAKIRKNYYKWNGLIEALATIRSYSSSNFSLDAYPKNLYKKYKSLGSLSSEFLRIFIQSKGSLTLEYASLYLLNNFDEDEKKTKIRRLYDIVNVFKCMGLVYKNKSHGYKPSYRWLGCTVLYSIVYGRSQIKLYDNSSYSNYKTQFFMSTPKTDNSSRFNSYVLNKRIFKYEESILKEYYSEYVDICNDIEKDWKIIYPVRKSTETHLSVTGSPFPSNQKTEFTYFLEPLNQFQKIRSRSYESTEYHKMILENNYFNNKKNTFYGKINNVQKHKNENYNIFYQNENQSYLSSILTKYQNDGVIELDDVIQKFYEQFWIN